MQTLSPLRALLASFHHAYAVATHLRASTGQDQFVVRTGDPIQPFRVTASPPTDTAALLARVL